MRARGTTLVAVCGMVFLWAACLWALRTPWPICKRASTAKRAAFIKAKLLGKLGDAQFEEARRASKAGEYDAVGLTLEKYRDNVRSAIEALKKQHPDAEKQSNGYRQLQIHVHKAIRELTIL